MSNVLRSPLQQVLTWVSFRFLVILSWQARSPVVKSLLGLLYRYQWTFINSLQCSINARKNNCIDEVGQFTGCPMCKQQITWAIDEVDQFFIRLLH